MNLNRKIALLALGKALRALEAGSNLPDPYVNGDDRRYLGESDYGTIMAPKAGTADWWEPFNVTRPGHLHAWVNTFRDGRIAFLDLERVES